MPSQPPDPGWNFGSVYDLIDTVPHNVGSPGLHAETRSPPNLDGGVGLGNFGKLWESLGLPASASAPPLPAVDESDLSNSDDALLPSPVLGVVDKHPKQDDDVPVKATEEAAPTILTKKQRQRARKQAEKLLQEQAAKDELSDPTTGTAQNETKQVIILKPNKPANPPTTPIRAQSNVGAKMRAASPVRPRSPTKVETLRSPIKLPGTKTHKRSKSSGLPSTSQLPVQAQVQLSSAGIAQSGLPATPPALQHHPYSQFVPLQPFSYTAPHRHNLIPSAVRLTSISRSTYANAVPMPATPSPAPPPYLMHPPQSTFTIRSQVDRHFNLFNKLLSQFPGDRKWLVAPRQLVNESTIPEGIHVFVDASNIMFGFQDMLRNSGLQPFDMSFDSLALLMERRRPVAKRVFVGSHREANPLPQVSKLVETSKAVGYECNVQEQVYIVREQSEKKKFFNDVKRVGWHKATQLRTGSGSDSETGSAMPKTPSAPKWVEQGVDELLHLKMCQSIIDTEQPTTMVLATGDGAAAEMSDGFLAHVERALRNGWQVELITWRQQTNGGYKRKTFRQKWGDQFRIIELDDFLEDLVDTP